MPEYTTTISIPEPIVPRDPLEDVIEEQAIEVEQLDETHWAAAANGKLLAIEDTKEKANKRAREHVGEHPPFIDHNGNVLEIDFGDVLRLASRRPWIGRDPAQATLMIEVFREYRDAEREGRAMKLTKEQVTIAKTALTQEENPDPRAGDRYLAAAYTPVVVSQIHENLIKRFVAFAEGKADETEGKSDKEPEENSKSNGTSKSAPKKKSGSKGSRKRA